MLSIGWGSAEFVEGVPTLLRHPIAVRSSAKLTLRAFLDQPLILYGHHEAADGGPTGLLKVVEPGSSPKITLSPLDAIEPTTVPAPRPRPLAVAHRLASKARDRLRPIASRVSH